MRCEDHIKYTVHEVSSFDLLRYKTAAHSNLTWSFFVWNLCFYFLLLFFSIHAFFLLHSTVYQHVCKVTVFIHVYCDTISNII